MKRVRNYATVNYKDDGKTIQNTRKALNEAAKTRHITIRWIKAHVNHYGNELADILAKDGAQGLGTEPFRTIPLSASTFNTAVDQYMVTKWNERWKQGKDARQTRIFFPEINLKQSKELRKLSRDNLSMAIRAITGHDFRRRHESIVQGFNLGNCRLCQQGEESADHLVNKCPTLIWKRMESFASPLGSQVTPHWQPKQLVAFLSDPSISELELPE